VSRLAAAQKPDLVIHVGDYYYRESPCPLQLKACAGSPSGDRWDTWTAEFFDPAAPLLAAAPWVFARGNHETCDRGGRGWFQLLDAGPAPGACQDITAPFAVRAGDLNLYVLDSGAIDDRSHDKAEVAAIAGQLDRLGPAVDQGRGWIITHRPFWGLVPLARVGPTAPFEVGLNFAEQDAARGRALAGVQMVVSGHVHHFQALDFGPNRPAQLVVGTGGDVGEKADLPQIYTERRVIDGLDAGVFSFSRYGYYLMEKEGEDWIGTFHDADDRIRARCRLHDRRLNCRAPR
jgi:predicted phosphodiesterase